MVGIGPGLGSDARLGRRGRPCGSDPVGEVSPSPGVWGVDVMDKDLPRGWDRPLPGSPTSAWGSDDPLPHQDWTPPPLSSPLSPGSAASRRAPRGPLPPTTSPACCHPDVGLTIQPHPSGHRGLGWGRERGCWPPTPRCHLQMESRALSVSPSVCPFSGRHPVPTAAPSSPSSSLQTA